VDTCLALSRLSGIDRAYLSGELFANGVLREDIAALAAAAGFCFRFARVRPRRMPVSPRTGSGVRPGPFAAMEKICHDIF